MRDNPNRRLSDGGVLLEILLSIPDRRGAEGKRFDLATVLLFTILGMIGGANSYRQMHEFIRVHRERLNAAFGLSLAQAPCYTGLRRILRGVDAHALEAAFRTHTASRAPSSKGVAAIAVDGKTLRGSFDAFADKRAAQFISAIPLRACSPESTRPSSRFLPSTASRRNFGTPGYRGTGKSRMAATTTCRLRRRRLAHSQEPGTSSPACDPSPTIRASGENNIKNARYRSTLDLTLAINLVNQY